MFRTAVAGVGDPRDVISLQLLARKRQGTETRADVVVLCSGRGGSCHVRLGRMRVDAASQPASIAVNWGVEAPIITGWAPISCTCTAEASDSGPST